MMHEDAVSMYTMEAKVLLISIILGGASVQVRGNSDPQVENVTTDGTQVLLEGTEARLQCKFAGEPSILFWGKKALIGDPIKPKRFIGWTGNQTLIPGNDTRYQIGKDCSLLFIVEKDDAGRYYCELSINGVLTGGYTDVTLAVPPSDPFPYIMNYTIPDGNNSTDITCRADRGSIGLVNLSWERNGAPYPHTHRNVTNADERTENVSATITVPVSNKPYVYLCVATLNTTPPVNATLPVTVWPHFETTSAPGTTRPTLINNAIAVVVPTVVILMLLVIALVVVAVYFRNRIRQNLSRCLQKTLDKRRGGGNTAQGTLRQVKMETQNNLLMTPISGGS